MIRIGILRRNGLTPLEEALVHKMFPNQPVEFISLHPSDHLEHAQLCDDRQVDLVFLPKDRPIPSTAMERGIPHVCVVGSSIIELMPMKFEFKPFRPRLKD